MVEAALLLGVGRDHHTALNEKLRKHCKGSHKEVAIEGVMTMA